MLLDTCSNARPPFAAHKTMCELHNKVTTYLTRWRCAGTRDGIIKFCSSKLRVRIGVGCIVRVCVLAPTCLLCDLCGCLLVLCQAHLNRNRSDWKVLSMQNCSGKERNGSWNWAGLIQQSRSRQNNRALFYTLHGCACVRVQVRSPVSRKDIWARR